MSFLLIGSALAESTLTTSEQPIAFTRSVRPMTLVSPAVPESPDVAALLLEDEHSPNGGPYWFAISRPVRATPQTDGMWEDLDSNTLLWRIPVVAPGALSLSLGFSRYHMPPGGRLFVYSDDHRQFAGPYTSRDNAEDGELHTPTMACDSLIVELMIPLVEVPKLELELSCVNYGFRPFGPTPATPKSGQIHAFGMGDAATCNRANDAACYEGTWGDQIRSVALCEVRLGQGVYGGTGTLVNNTAQDDKPYFLTAFHVVDIERDEDQKRDLAISNAEKKAIERMFVYWNFQARTCGDTSGSVAGQYQAGATFVAGYWSTDFALVELKEKPPSQANVYYAGWDRSTTVLSGGVAIHHPQADLKKVSRENDPLEKWPITYNGVEYGTYFIVEKWEAGTGMTEDSSSGCSFFALAGKRTVGQLMGGSGGTCDNPGWSAFGPLYRSWSEGPTRDTRLSDWLDPANTGVMYLDGKNPSAGASSLPNDLVEVGGAQYASLTGLASGSQTAQDQQKQAVQQLKLPLEVRTKQTGIVLRLIPAGTFTIGSPASEAWRWSDEGPQHQVTLTKAFYCSKFEVTQGQWEAVMGENPSYFKSADLDAPVEQVSWEECQTFLAMLCQKEDVPELTYRLLTEAEWEYACRAGTTTTYYWGDSDYWSDRDSVLGQYAWDYHSSFDRTHVVGQKNPNAFGLHDMSGNVWEWCKDWYGWGYYSVSPGTDPLGPASGDLRVVRGGGFDGVFWDDIGAHTWISGGRLCRSAIRVRRWDSSSSWDLGLRLVRTIP
jgi:formylglycine-generating enzyme required for sulfatase activity